MTMYSSLAARDGFFDVAMGLTSVIVSFPWAGSVQSTTQASGYSRRDLETMSQRTGLGTQHPEAGGFTPRSGGPGYQPTGSQRSLSSW